MSTTEPHNHPVSSHLTPKAVPVVLIILLTGSVVGLSSIFDTQFVTNDGAQYISVANNLMKGKGLATDIIYYDQQYISGGVPATQTVFAPGYSILISLGSLLGLAPTDAAFVVSLIAFALIPILIFWLLTSSGHPRGLSFALTASWFFIVAVWFNVLNCLSEMTFALFTLISLACFARAQKEPHNQILWLGLAAFLAGLAFSVRYAGMFYVASVVLYFLLHLAKNKDKRSLRACALVTGLSSLPPIVVLARNYYYVGDLRGGPSGLPGTAPIEVLRDFYWSLSGLLGFSRSGFLNANPADLGLVMLLVGISVFLFTNRQWVNIDRARPSIMLSDVCGALPGLYMLITIVGISYLSLSSVAVTFSTRYLIPLVPFSVLILAALLRTVSVCGTQKKRVSTFLLVVTAAVFLAGQVNVFRDYWAREGRENDYTKVTRALQQSLHSGTVFDLLRKGSSVSRPLLGNEAQLLGLVTNRPVIGLAAKKYSRRVWTNSEVEKLVAKYHVSYVVFFDALFDTADPWLDNQLFFAHLKKGEIPSWLQPVFLSDKFQLYRVTSLIPTS